MNSLKLDDVRISEGQEPVAGITRVPIRRGSWTEKRSLHLESGQSLHQDLNGGWDEIGIFKFCLPLDKDTVNRPMNR